MSVNIQITGPIQFTRGLKANLPTTGLPGQAFFCTDTDELFVWDGSAMAGPAVSIAAEASTRAAADTTLTTNLAAEVSRAEAAEASINTALSGKQNIINFVDSEQPSGQGSGATVLTLAHTPGSAGSVRVFQNGIRLARGSSANQYSVSGAVITLVTALSATDVVTVDYGY